MGAQAILFGIGAAASWGLADYFIAILTRKAGYLRTLALVLGGATVFLALVAATTPTPRLTAAQWISCLALAPLSLIFYLSFYRALELGPISIVSPVASASAVVTVLLSVLLLEEALSVGQALGVGLTVCGVVLAAVVLGRIGPDVRRLGRGVFFALCAMVGAGLYLFALGVLSQKIGWLMPIAVSRAASFAVLVLAAGAARAWSGERPSWNTVVIGALLGVLETVGYLSFNRGAELGYVSIVSAASSVYPLIPIVGGVVLLGERVAPNQGVGLVLVVGGLVVLGVSS